MSRRASERGEEEEVEAFDEDLWSSPLMHYQSPFDDYKNLYDDIEKDKDSSVFVFPCKSAMFRPLLC